MEAIEIIAQLPSALLSWYDAVKRDLPWRQDRDPYHIWISEIMLQQTRVEAVKGYYARFLQALPAVEALANAFELPANLTPYMLLSLGYRSATCEPGPRHTERYPMNHTVTIL